jgi:O-methyltransferase
MFYGVPPERVEDLKQALSTIEDIYKGKFYCNDMIICLWRNLSFQYDKKFMAGYRESITNDQERSLLWRVHTLAWAAKNALNVEGDFVECGVFKGFCSSVIFKYLEFQDLPRQAYLYDTFKGLPEKTSTEEERKLWDYTQYDPEEVYDTVCEKFAAYKNVNIVRGIVPDSFKTAVPEIAGAGTSV